MITICFTYFKSLTLAHLAAALYSVRQQDFFHVERIVVVDNDTINTFEEIRAIIEALCFPVPVYIFSLKHGDLTLTHSWSTNVAVREAATPWVFFCRADYLLAFDALKKFWQEVRDQEWDGFVTSNGCHLSVDIGVCEQTSWRQIGPKVLQGVGSVYDYTCIDSGVWLARRDAFDRVGGLDENLIAWGHAQTHFQWKLHQSGIECRRIEEVLFYHPAHGGAKDLGLANQQIAERGVSLQEMWSRYEGPRMY